ncbi:hypothetical protein [Teredinibacter purpureus]|uniref:hypothetical protein n=1 Tax=Teredinibacter purpureus TaxID=2731756 RepID=UPI0005F7C749|nr:hypothetical protein [Teredinibacter purpureus]
MEAIFGYLINIITFGWKKRREADIELFRKLYSELEFNSDSATLLREHDFSNGFQFKYLQQLNYIAEYWLYENIKFHSWLVERRKNKFIENLNKFINELSLHTGMDHGGLISIGLHEASKKEKGRKKKAAKTINKLSIKAYKSYERFVKSYKKQLNA